MLICLGEVVVEYTIPYFMHKLATAMGENIGRLGASFNGVLDVVRKLCECNEPMSSTKTEAYIPKECMRYGELLPSPLCLGST